MSHCPKRLFCVIYCLTISKISYVVSQFMDVMICVQREGVPLTQGIRPIKTSEYEKLQLKSPQNTRSRVGRFRQSEDRFKVFIFFQIYIFFSEKFALKISCMFFEKPVFYIFPKNPLLFYQKCFSYTCLKNFVNLFKKSVFIEMKTFLVFVGKNFSCAFPKKKTISWNGKFLCLFKKLIFDWKKVFRIA